MIVKLFTEHHLEFLSLNRGCRGSFESTFVKMSNCWKSHAAAHLLNEKQCVYDFLYFKIWVARITYIPRKRLKDIKIILTLINLR